ncbi:hypothetical protein [Marivirga sp.]|uniref:hypothetical protein n=1 Tax=Marivirga sp. TaxID=2018662 RepID=UPI0025D7EBA8|nr:hypothetical protein [Marivirga sp.]
MNHRFQILCATKKIANGELIITQIGGRNPLCQIWSLKVDQAIEGIQSGNWEFFINSEGKSYPVQLIESKLGKEIVTQGTNKNLILDLPDLPNL